MEAEKFETEKLPSLNAERILTALEIAIQKIEILEAIPELCTRILARDINVETVLGEETSGALVHLALLRRKWESENDSGAQRVSTSEGSGVSGTLRDYSGSDSSVSPWSSSLSRRSNKSKGKDRKGVVAEKGIWLLSNESVQELKYVPSESGINLRKREGRRESVGSQCSHSHLRTDSNGSNRNSSGSGQSEESTIGASASEDVLEGRKAKSVRKNIEEAVALLCNDSSEVTFLRDVINASVTNVPATNKHSHVDNLPGNYEGNNLESAGGAEEQIDVRDMSHSVSTRSNNMMQLIRQALNSKYGDHTRRCIKDKDAKALLCILSLLDPHHCFTVTETANPIKGTKSNNTELPRQTRQSNSSLTKTHPPPHFSNKSSSPSPTNLSQLATQEQEQEQLVSLHILALKNNLSLHQDQHENETNLHSAPISTNLHDVQQQHKQFNQLHQENSAFISSGELRRHKLIQKKSESLGQSGDRILETIEEVEYQEQDDYYARQFQQISSSQSQSPARSTTHSSTQNHKHLNQDCKSDLQFQQIFQISHNELYSEEDSRLMIQKESERESEDSGESYNVKQIATVQLQEHFPTNPSSSSKYISENLMSHPTHSITKPNYENECELQITSEMLKGDSDSMAEYFLQLDNLTGRNSDTNGTEKSISKSVSLSFISDDNITTTTTSTDEPKWFKDITSECISKESLKKQMQELFRSICKDFLFNIPAIDFIKRMKKERESTEEVIKNSNSNSDLSNCIVGENWQKNGINDSLHCSEGLLELKKLVVELHNLMRSKFVMNFEEERKQTKYCRDLWIKEQRNLRKIQNIKAHLETVASNRAPKLVSLDAEIDGLQQELNALPEKSLRCVKIEIMEGLKANLKMRKIHSNTLEATMERMKVVQKAYDSLAESNFVAECKYRERLHNMEKQLENIILKYDVEIDARQQLLDGFDVEEQKLQREIQIEDDKFKDVDDRYLDMRAAKRIKEIMKGIEVANSFKKTWAARRIQEAWRRYKIMKLKKKKRKGLKKKSSKANLKKGSATAGPEVVKKDREAKSKSSDSVSSPENLRSRSQSVVSNSKPGSNNSKKGSLPKQIK